MSWDLYRGIQYSLKDFLVAEAASDSLVDSDGESINFQIGRRNDQNWELNTITIYLESETSERAYVGSNQRFETYLVIIDIYAKTEIDRYFLARWTTEAINDGWQNYTYTYNAGNPELPTKSTNGYARINFLSNTRVALGQTISEFDRNRHRISILVEIVS